MSRPNFSLRLCLGLVVVVVSATTAVAQMGGAMPQSSQQQPLPEGHPSLEGDGAHAHEQGSATLLIRAVQGSAGGPAAGTAPVEVMLYQGGEVVRRIERKLNDKGELQLEQTFTGIVQPIAVVTYDGVAYQSVGQPIRPDGQTHELTATIYEMTADAPNWRIKMRHVMVNPTAGGLHVTEVLVVNNPADRTWTGDSNADVHENQADQESGETHENAGVTFTLSLPKGVEQVKPGEGFHSCCTHLHGGVLFHTMPLTPGDTRFSLHYRVPVQNSKAALSLDAPAPIDRLVVILPESNQVQVAAEQMRHESMAARGRKLELYKADAIKADQIRVLHFTGLPATTATEASAPKGSARQNLSKAAAGTVAVVFVVGAIVLMLFKGGRPTAPVESDGAKGKPQKAQP